LLALVVAAVSPLSAQNTESVEYRNAIAPVLQKHCQPCHNGKVGMANLSFQGGPKSPEVWGKVLDKVSTGQMPPPGSPALSETERALVTDWIEKTVGTPRGGSPGRVTAHRLNRAEYNNTVRDLLGVSIRPADEFPLDDAGYGFDNIGDVLSVSPLLMEKYLAAARAVSQAAVYGLSAPAKPTKLIRFMSKKSQDDPTPNALPFSYRGAAYGKFNFPVEAEYEFRMRVANYRPRLGGSARQKQLGRKTNLTPAETLELSEENRKSDPPVKMVMSIDGAPILTETVEGNIDFQYAHGESVARVKLKAGEHQFRASFPEFAGMENPRENLNSDGRRKLFIDYIDIVGPFHPSSSAPESRKLIFVCKQQTPECARLIIKQLARRAYRRALTEWETDGLVNLAALVRKEGDSFDEGIRVALQAVLTSPNFLFRVEREPSQPGTYTLGQHELASRLSYFLWSSMPDEALMRAADQGRLQGAEALEVQVRRMLKDARAEALVDNFAGQWLGLRLLDRRKPDPAHFPVADDELMDSMRRETSLFTLAVLRENRSLLDFIDGKFSFVNGILAHHYGLPGVTGEDFERVKLDGEQRSGVITQASVLTLSSYATRTSPVLRGKWVLENLLGTAPPPPPPDIPALIETNLGTQASQRQRLEQHRANPSCAVCHNQMDPIGFGLENYDATGAWRKQDGNFPVDSSGALPGGKTFEDPKELKIVLKSQTDLFIRNLTEKMFTYALGRGVEQHDNVAITRIVKRLAENEYRFSTLVTEIVKDPAFQQREGLSLHSGTETKGAHIAAK